MNRQNILEGAFLFDGFEIDGNQIFPLSANRRAFLRRKGNSICEGEGGKLDKVEEMGECLFACTLKPQQLMKFSDAEWEKAVEDFIITSPDHLLEKFTTEVENEGERLQLAAVESLGKDTAQ